MLNYKSKIGLMLELGNGKTFELHEGDIVHDLSYMVDDVKKHSTGTIRVLEGGVKTNINRINNCPPEPYLNNYVTISSIIVDSSSEFDAELTRVSVKSICDIASIEAGGDKIHVELGPQYNTIEQTIINSPDNSVIEIGNGEYADPITITKSVKLIGHNGATITGPIKIINDDSDPDNEINIELYGLLFTEDATIECSNINKLIVNNCTFRDYNIENENLSINPYIISINGSTPVHITIRNNMFGSGNEIFNGVFNSLAPIANGSEFITNEFDKDCCAGSQITLCDTTLNATINVQNNYCYSSNNMLDLRFISDTMCTVNVIGNEYTYTDDGDYAGIVRVQPYGQDTVTMSNVKINIKDTKKPEGQIAYLFCDEGDMQFDDSNKPIITVDGTIYNPTVYTSRVIEELSV